MFGRLTDRTRPAGDIFGVSFYKFTGLVIVSSVLCGCAGCKDQPWAGAGGPTVRVLLTREPVEGARISTSGGYSLSVDDRRVDSGRRQLGPCKVTRSGPTWRIGKFRAQGRTVRLTTTADALVRLGDTAYRGELYLHRAGQSGFVAVNHVDVESYLAGVLPKELYPHWTLTMYCAQAVSARTYALFKQSFLGGATYDLASGQADQVYGGASAETPKSRRAVQATRGWVLGYGAEGSERIFLSQYSACNGGVVNPAYVLRAAARIRPLMGGQRDEDGRRCPRFRWAPVKVPKPAIWRAVGQSYPSAKKLGGVVSIGVAEATSYGRAVWVDLTGTSGQKMRLRADDLRLCLLRDGPAQARKLYSMNCRLRDLGDAIEFYDGRGYGHGVGLSQWGAEDKARAGWDVQQILQFYYPGAKIFKAY